MPSTAHNMTSDTATVQPTHVVAVCPTCQEIRYHSIRPVASQADCVASNFQPIGEAPALPDGSAPVCHVCQAMLSFAPADKMKGVRAPETVDRQAVERAPIRTMELRPEDTLPEVETLFEVRGDEQLMDLRNGAAGIIIVTNRRIVRLKV